jgi:hypothetical protein
VRSSRAAHKYRGMTPHARPSQARPCARSADVLGSRYLRSVPARAPRHSGGRCGSTRLTYPRRWAHTRRSSVFVLADEWRPRAHGRCDLTSGETGVVPQSIGRVRERTSETQQLLSLVPPAPTVERCHRAPNRSLVQLRLSRGARSGRKLRQPCKRPFVWQFVAVCPERHLKRLFGSREITRRRDVIDPCARRSRKTAGAVT